MQTINPKEQLRKVRVALTLNLVASAFMVFGLITAIGSGVKWRIVCSSVATAAFFFLAFAVFIQLLKLQKQFNS